MTCLTTAPVARLLQRLFAEADEAAPEIEAMHSSPGDWVSISLD